MGRRLQTLRLGLAVACASCAGGLGEQGGGVADASGADRDVVSDAVEVAITDTLPGDPVEPESEGDVADSDRLAVLPDVAEVAVEAGAVAPGKQGGAVTADGARYVFEMPDEPFAGGTHVPAADSISFGIWRDSADGDYQDGVHGVVQFAPDGSVRRCDQFANPSQLRWRMGEGGGANTNSVDAQCAIQVSVRPKCPGDWMVGTFEGKLVNATTGQTVELTGGEFAVRVDFVLHGAPPAAGCPPAD